MKTRAQVQREIKIARACFGAGLNQYVEDFGTERCTLNDPGKEKLKKRFYAFLERRGSRKEKGQPVVALAIEDLQAYLVAHSEFIMDPYAEPGNLAEYVDVCRGATATVPRKGLTLDDIAILLANMEKRIAALEPNSKPEVESEEVPTVEHPHKKRPGRPRKNPLPETG
jgi:hypothetical protein